MAPVKSRNAPTLRGAAPAASFRRRSTQCFAQARDFAVRLRRGPIDGAVSRKRRAHERRADRAAPSREATRTPNNSRESGREHAATSRIPYEQVHDQAIGQKCLLGAALLQIDGRLKRHTAKLLHAPRRTKRWEPF